MNQTPLSGESEPGRWRDNATHSMKIAALKHLNDRDAICRGGLMVLAGDWNPSAARGVSTSCGGGACGGVISPLASYNITGVRSTYSISFPTNYNKQSGMWCGGHDATASIISR